MLIDSPILVKVALNTINHKSSNRRKTIYLQTCLPKTSTITDFYDILSSIGQGYTEKC
jgi:translation elongation factor EF-4